MIIITLALNNFQFRKVIYYLGYLLIIILSVAIRFFYLLTPDYYTITII
jgi:hypothetical protein